MRRHFQYATGLNEGGIVVREISLQLSDLYDLTSISPVAARRVYIPSDTRPLVKTNSTSIILQELNNSLNQLFYTRYSSGINCHSFI